VDSRCSPRFLSFRHGATKPFIFAQRDILHFLEGRKLKYLVTLLYRIKYYLSNISSTSNPMQRHSQLILNSIPRHNLNFHSFPPFVMTNLLHCSLCRSNRALSKLRPTSTIYYMHGRHCPIKRTILVNAWIAFVSKVEQIVRHARMYVPPFVRICVR